MSSDEAAVTYKDVVAERERVCVCVCVCVEQYKECIKTGSRCVTQAALQRLYPGGIPLLSGMGALTWSVSDLGRCTRVETTCWSRMQLRGPELKRSSSLSFLGVWITGAHHGAALKMTNEQRKN